MTISSQNTLLRRKGRRDANQGSYVYGAGNIPVRKVRVIPPTVPYRQFEPCGDSSHDARLEQAKQVDGNHAVEKLQQTAHGQNSHETVEVATETAVDSPFSQMSITEQERERQPPQQQPPPAEMVWSRQSTQEPGEIREDSPGARRRGKLPVRDFFRPATAWPSVPEFGGIEKILLRSDVVPGSPLFVTPNDTPGSSAMSPESMEADHNMRIVWQLEARRDAEDATYEPSQAGTPAQWLFDRAAEEELAKEAEMLASGHVVAKSIRRKSAQRPGVHVVERGPPIANVQSTRPIEDVRSEDDPPSASSRQPDLTPPPRPVEDRSTSAPKRRSPELVVETPLKRQKRYEKEAGLLQSRAYDTLKDKGKTERDTLLAKIEHLWGIPCHEAIPKSLWLLHTTKRHQVHPRDWANERVLSPVVVLADLTLRDPQRAVKALREAISTRTQILPHSPARIYVERDLARAIEIAAAEPVSPTQTLGRSQHVEVTEETLADVLRRTAEPTQSNFYEPVPGLAEEDSDDSITIAKTDSSPSSPITSQISIKLESSSPTAATIPRLLQNPKSRFEVRQMSVPDFEDFYEKSEKRFDNAKVECFRRLRPADAGASELSVLSNDQLEEYRNTAKADWDLAQQEWRRRADETRRREAIANAIVIE